MLHWENAKQIETQSTYLKELLHSRKEMSLWSIYTHYLPTGMCMLLQKNCKSKQRLDVYYTAF